MSSYYYTENKYSTITRQVCSQLVIMLPGAGCEWAKKSGGCYMCGFSGATRKYSRGLLLPALVFKTMLKKALSKNPAAEIAAVYNGGSFLNPREIPTGVPVWLCKKLSELPNIRQLFVESRPEFVDAELITNMLNNFRSKTLKVGIGLECLTNSVRQRCVHKGFSLSDYERAVKILQDLGVQVLTYVFLKPLFLNEAEAIEEAVKTIEYVLTHGSGEVALESAFVQKGTLMYKFYQEGEFRPPWLWSIIEVVRRTYHIGHVHVGGFRDEPPPIAVPSNCSRCTPIVEVALQKFRENHNLQVFDELDCDCQTEWHRELKRFYPVPDEGLRSRIA